MDSIEKVREELLAVARRHIPMIAVHPNPMPCTFGMLHSGNWPAAAPAEAVLKGVFGLLPPFHRGDIQAKLEAMAADTSALDAAAAAVGADHTFFLVNGSTVGNQAMLMAAVRDGQKVIITRAAHRSVYAGLILSGATPVYIAPRAHPQVHFPLAVSVVNEKITGTFEQLQVTPATSLEILLGKILPLGGVFAFDVVLMMIVAGFVLHVWPEGNVVFFVLVSSFYELVSLALGVIISATSTTAAAAVQKSVLLSIPLVQLSGFAFPIRNMPLPVRWVAEIFPATHYIRVSRAIYLRGEGPLGLSPELLLLVLFGALLMAYALRTIEARR